MKLINITSCTYLSPSDTACHYVYHHTHICIPRAHSYPADTDPRCKFSGLNIFAGKKLMIVLIHRIPKGVGGRGQRTG